MTKYLTIKQMKMLAESTGQVTGIVAQISDISLNPAEIRCLIYPDGDWPQTVEDAQRLMRNMAEWMLKVLPKDASHNHPVPSQN